ncbi:hypothetical protein [Niallia nealsonii]|nr:hypothetical protein [Niallia nealsonii]
MEHTIQFALKSFQFGSPHPEDCCRLRVFFLQKNEPKAALYWFQFTTIIPEVDDGGIIHQACSTWIPHLQQCICHSRLGDMNKAYKHIVIAPSFYPNHKLILKK